MYAHVRIDNVKSSLIILKRNIPQIEVLFRKLGLKLCGLVRGNTFERR